MKSSCFETAVKNEENLIGIKSGIGQTSIYDFKNEVL